jgi:hypothetical protein
MGGQVNVLGNVIADTFLGNIVILGNISAPYFLGNVIARGNVDAANVTAGNISVTGQVNVVGNVIANNFLGNLVSSGNLSASYFLGNVIARGNVDAGNVTAGNLLSTGNMNVVGNVIASNFIGNLLASSGNVSAPFFVGNLIARGNIQAVNLSAGNVRVTSGNLNVRGNVSGRFFLGNVISEGNVDANNVSTSFIYTAQANIGNIVLSSGVVTVPTCFRFPSFIGCSYRGAFASYTNGSFQTISYPTQVYDPRGLWNGTTFTAPVTGYYNVTFYMFIESGGFIMIAINVNTNSVFARAEVNRGGGGGVYPQYQHAMCTGITLLNAGETVNLRIQPIDTAFCIAEDIDRMSINLIGGAF